MYATVLLPEPDSPTSPNVSPSSTENETSSTARTVPREVVKNLRSFSTSRILLFIGLTSVQETSYIVIVSCVHNRWD